VPRFWCECAVCQEARTGGLNRRTRPSALLRGGNGETLLLDCGPDLHAQFTRFGHAFVPGTVLISHAHNDHLLGLGDLLDYVTYAGGKLDIYAPKAVLPDVRARFAYAFRREAPVQPLPEDGLLRCGYRVRSFEVPHGANGVSHAFHFVAEQDGTDEIHPCRWVYMTDAIGVPDALAREWLQDLDLLVLGASLRDESGAVQATRSVYDVREALSLPWALAARRVLLSHLSHDIDVRRPLPFARYSYASDGLSVSLGVRAAPRTGRP
jgi:phosphoribosyl 1,2-cyclic phosphate phosphodiesterase